MLTSQHHAAAAEFDLTFTNQWFRLFSAILCHQKYLWKLKTSNLIQPTHLFSITFSGSQIRCGFGVLTSLLLDISQAPHDSLLCVVGLAGVASCRSDSFVSNSVEIQRMQSLISAVAPQLLTHTSMELFGKCLHGGQKDKEEMRHLFPYCIQLPLDTGDIKGLYASKHRLKSRVSAWKTYDIQTFVSLNKTVGSHSPLFIRL